MFLVTPVDSFHVVFTTPVDSRYVHISSSCS